MCDFDGPHEVLVNVLTRLDTEVRALGSTLKCKPKFGEEFDIFDWPRPRVVTVCDGITWPWRENDSAVHPVFSDYVALMLDKKVYLSFDEGYKRLHIAGTIIARCRLRPRQVLRAVRRLEVAADWCNRRLKGTLRAMDELAAQQSRWSRELLREHHLLELGGGVTPPNPIS